MSFPTQVAAAAIDVYVITGTSGDADTPELEVEELIPEMTRTLTAKAGDKLIINFGCSGHGTGYDESEVVLTYRIKVNGATIEPDKRVQGGYVPYYYEAVMYVGVNMVRF